MISASLGGDPIPVADTLAEVHAALPPSLVRTGHQPAEPPELFKSGLRPPDDPTNLHVSARGAATATPFRRVGIH